MDQDEDYTELTEFLKNRGHSPKEIEKIIVRVRRYERETQLDSIMDSIGKGTLNLEGLIKEALGE